MSRKVRWGVLSTAAIGTEKVIPAMQLGELSTVAAIAGRDAAKARAVAGRLGIPRAYGSYEELLRDPEIDVIYNPLPNHLHVPWTMAAARAGKHVLCEKPISMTVAEAESLLQVREQTGVVLGEAFMIRCHPQWQRAREWIVTGKIGELRAVVVVFSYFNRDAGNIRNVPEYGGGGLMDIGCYGIQAARYGFGGEPSRVVGLVELDPEFRTDRLTSAMMEFAGGQAIFTCSTQMVPYQRVQFLGTRGRIEIEIPFNAPPDRHTRIFLDQSGDLTGASVEQEIFPVVDQYTLQGDAFSRAILAGTPPPVTLEDAIANMRVIEAIFRSARSGLWEKPLG
jgi:predicted dehydrogenase